MTDVANINVPNLIKTQQYYQYYSMIKNYEDTLQKIISSNKSSSDNTFIWNISDNENNELFPDLVQLDLQQFELDLDINVENIVIIGPYVRSCIIKNDEQHIKNAEIRNELYLYKIGDTQWSDVTNLDNFAEKKTEFVFENNGKKVYLIKKKFKSLSHVIMQNNYLKRCGWFNGDFYVSSMFLLEIQKHINLLHKNFRDPILHRPYDPLEIYKIASKEKIHPVKIIDTIDHRELLKINPKNLTKLFNSKTCIELCVDKISKETKTILTNQLKQMILYLCCHKYKRPPYLYAKLTQIDTKFPELYDILKNICCEYEDIPVIEDEFNSIEDINNAIILEFIKTDDVNFFDFSIYSRTKINKVIIDQIIKHNAINITKQIISNSLVDANLAYYLVLMMESLNTTQLFQEPFDMDIAFNYLKDILENGKIRLFYFLYDNDKSIINTLFEDGCNILHCIKPNGNYQDLIKLIIKLKPELINVHNENKETPLIYHAKYNPSLLDQFSHYEFDPLLKDNDGNIFLHHLCKLNNINVLKNALKRCPEILDLPNNDSETPAIVACKNNAEDMFYTLKMFGANLEAEDYFGNTVYHYICVNSMCIGMIINNKENHFGLTPRDYCKISPSFYDFQ